MPAMYELCTCGHLPSLHDGQDDFKGECKVPGCNCTHYGSNKKGV